MYVVIFRAVVSGADEEYNEMGALMEKLAIEEFGCLEAFTMVDGDRELLLAYWPDLESIAKFKAQAQHLDGQRIARERWYSRYHIQVARIERDYSFQRHDYPEKAPAPPAPEAR